MSDAKTVLRELLATVEELQFVREPPVCPGCGLAFMRGFRGQSLTHCATCRPQDYDSRPKLFDLLTPEEKPHG